MTNRMMVKLMKSVQKGVARPDRKIKAVDAKNVGNL